MDTFNSATTTKKAARGGAVMASGAAYGYAGPVCACAWVQAIPAADKTAWQRSYEREIAALEDEIERLRNSIDDAAVRIRRCDYTMARSVLLETLKTPTRPHGLSGAVSPAPTFERKQK